MKNMKQSLINGSVRSIPLATEKLFINSVKRNCVATADVSCNCSFNNRKKKYTMKRFLLSFILFFLIVVTNNSSAQTAAEFYFPLKVGNYWNYHTPGGPPYGWAPRTDLQTIDGTDLIVGHQFYRIKGVQILYQSPRDTILYHVLWARKDLSGNILIVAFSTNSTNIDSAIIINPPFPLFQNEFLNAGYTREFFDPIRDRYHQDSVISTTETVIVPAGTFTNCLKIREQDRNTNGVVTLLEYGF